MIADFADKETESVWHGERSAKLPVEIQQTARRKLRMINNAQGLEDLKIPPANRMEKRKGDLKEFYSIRINRQWRVVFRWERGNAYRVRITDYHG